MRAGSKSISNVLRVWRLMRGFTGEELRRLQSQPVSLAIAGSTSSRARLAGALAIAAGAATEYASAHEAKAAGEKLVLDADTLDPSSEKSMSAAVADLVHGRPELRVALAAKYPVFRAIVAEQLTREMAQQNAKLAAISALPGIIPLTDWLLPATAAGDMLALTRNQVNLLLEISAAYGLAPDPRERLMELAPVIGSAFGWRALAREALGLVPGGVGLAVKAGVAYAGTYAVGRAAAAYYATGQAVDSGEIFRSTLRAAMQHGQKLIGRGT